MKKFNDCFDIIGSLLSDLNLNLEDDVDICLTTDADEDGHHSPSLTIVNVETRESLLTVDLREAVKGVMCGELSYQLLVFSIFSKVCSILESDDTDDADGDSDEQEVSTKEACATPNKCPDAKYGLTDYETENMILSVHRKGALPKEVLEKVVCVSIDDDVTAVLSIFDEDGKIRHFSKERLANQLKLNKDELIARALRNMSLKWPSEIVSITNEVYSVEAPKSPYGATSVFYPNMLNRLFKKLDTDVFYAYPTEGKVFVSKNKRFIKIVRMADVWPDPLSDEIFVVRRLSNHAVNVEKAI